MRYHVEIDISMEESSVCAMDAKGEIVEEGKVATDPQAIDHFLNDYTLEDLEVGFETGPISSWLWYELTSLRFHAIMMDARSVHQFLKAQRNKTDRADARGIARVLRFGCYQEARARSYDNH